MSADTILGGTAKLWTNLLANKRVNKYLFFENFTILTLASWYMLASSYAGSVINNGPSKQKNE